MSILDFSSSNCPAVTKLSTVFGIILVGAMLIPIPTMAQHQVNPVPLTVVRRAIEAFDGAPFSTGYVVLEAAFPHTVRLVVPSLDSATTIISAAHEGELTYAGPFSHSPLGPDRIDGCFHLRRSSEVVCRPPFDFPIELVDSLELLVYLDHGEVTRLVLDSAVDAIFLGPTAMDKFVWPYLARYGAGYAAQRRQEYLDLVP